MGCQNSKILKLLNLISLLSIWVKKGKDIKASIKPIHCTHIISNQPTPNTDITDHASTEILMFRELKMENIPKILNGSVVWSTIKETKTSQENSSVSQDAKNGLIKEKSKIIISMDADFTPQSAILSTVWQSVIMVDGEYSENSEWICGLVNHKRDK